MDRGIDGPINKSADRWTNEQMDGWIRGWVNGWMDRHFYTWLSVCIPLMSKADFSPSSDVRACVCVCVHTKSTTFVLQVRAPLYVCQAAVLDKKVIFGSKIIKATMSSSKQA